LAKALAAGVLRGPTYIVCIDDFVRFDAVPRGRFYRSYELCASEPQVEGRENYYQKILETDSTGELLEWEDWDTPDSVDWDLYNSLLMELDRINRYSPKELPGLMERYSKYFHHVSNSGGCAGLDTGTIIVEGILIYHSKAYVSLFDQCIFLDAPYDLCWKRRRARDTVLLPRGDLWDDPPGYYSLVVWPWHIRMREFLLESGTLKDKMHIFSFSGSMEHDLVGNCLSFIPSVFRIQWDR
jgi:uridine kinase